MSNNALRNERMKIVRQDRIEPKHGSTWLRIKGGNQELEVLNYSPFGILAHSTSGAKIESADILHGTFRRGNFEAQDVRLSIVRSDGSTYAFEIMGEPLNIEVVRGIEAAEEVVAQNEELVVARKRLHPQFKHAVIELKDWLGTVAEMTNQKEKELRHADPYTRSQFESAFAQTLSSYLTRAFPAKHGELLKHAAEVKDQDMQFHLDFFREQLGPLIHQAPVVHRAYTKPRGYAGDFEMMNHLYRNEFEGDSLFARALHHYFVNEPAGQAVRNRRDFLLKKINATIKRCKAEGKSEVRFLSVASGPAKEAQDIIESISDDCPPIKWYLLDQDDESLKGAQFEIKKRYKGNKHQFNLVHMSIKDVIVKGVPFKDFDLVYSAGLFDYFTDPVCQVAASRLYEATGAGGEVIIGNFSEENPSLPLMSMALDWHLIYRSKETLIKMYKGIGNVDVETEPLGINLFAVFKK